MFERVARAVAAVCDVDMAHVSLMTDTTQHVIGHIGMGQTTFDRGRTLCAYPLARDDEVIFEDILDESELIDDSKLESAANVRFYAGFPLRVDATPVGTLCALDTNPRILDRLQHSELSGLAGAVESYLASRYRYGPTSNEHALCRNLTSARATAAEARFADGPSDFALRNIDRELRDCVDVLDCDTERSTPPLGFPGSEDEES